MNYPPSPKCKKCRSNRFKFNGAVSGNAEISGIPKREVDESTISLGETNKESESGKVATESTTSIGIIALVMVILFILRRIFVK